MKKKIKELKNKYMHWCDDCDNLAYDYLNPCSGYQQEKCQKEKEEWLKKEINALRKN